MKKYEAPELIKAEIKIEDVVLSTFTENGEGDSAGWLTQWTSKLDTGTLN